MLISDVALSYPQIGTVWRSVFVWLISNWVSFHSTMWALPGLSRRVNSYEGQNWQRKCNAGLVGREREKGSRQTSYSPLSVSNVQSLFGGEACVCVLYVHRTTIAIRKKAGKPVTHISLWGNCQVQSAIVGYFPN